MIKKPLRKTFQALKRDENDLSFKEITITMTIIICLMGIAIGILYGLIVLQETLKH